MKFDDLDIKMRVYETSHDFSQNEASSKIEKLSIADKNELLFQYGVNFNELPNWQKRGIGIYWKNTQKTGVNPKTNERVLADRRELFVNYDLPMREDYNRFISEIIDRSG